MESKLVQMFEESLHKFQKHSYLFRRCCIRNILQNVSHFIYPLSYPCFLICSYLCCHVGCSMVRRMRLVYVRRRKSFTSLQILQLPGLGHLPAQIFTRYVRICLIAPPALSSSEWDIEKSMKIGEPPEMLLFSFPSIGFAIYSTFIYFLHVMNVFDLRLAAELPSNMF